MDEHVHGCTVLYCTVLCCCINCKCYTALRCTVTVLYSESVHACFLYSSKSCFLCAPCVPLTLIALEKVAARTHVQYCTPHGWMLLPRVSDPTPPIITSSPFKNTTQLNYSQDISIGSQLHNTLNVLSSLPSTNFRNDVIERDIGCRPHRI